MRLEVGDSAEPLTATQISRDGAVVLCPVSVAARGEGVAVVWAEYPADDDQLQLMFTRVQTDSMTVVDGPRSIGMLSDELAALSISSDSTGFQIQALEMDSDEPKGVHVHQDGTISLQNADLESASLAESCDAAVSAQGTQISVFRGQLDAELPLYIEASTL